MEENSRAVDMKDGKKDGDVEVWKKNSKMEEKRKDGEVKKSEERW